MSEWQPMCPECGSIKTEKFDDYVDCIDCGMNYKTTDRNVEKGKREIEIKKVGESRSMTIYYDCGLKFSCELI